MMRVSDQDKTELYRDDEPLQEIDAGTVVYREITLCEKA